MKKINILVAVICLGIITFSCKKDNVGDGFQDIAFGTESVEQNKAKLETSGQDFMTQINDLRENQGIQTISVLMTLMSDNAPFKSASAKNNLVFKTINDLKAAADKSDASLLKNALLVASEEPGSISEVWEEIKGIYTWNSSIEDWDVSPSSTMAEFHFPSTENGTINDAVFTISSYEGFVPTMPIEDYQGDLPKKLDADLKLDGTEVFSFNFQASYTNKAEPTSVSVSVSLTTFVMSVSLTNNNSNVSVSYSFKNGNDIILDAGVSLNGNFSRDNLEGEPDDIDDVLYNANAHFQVLNVKLAGTIDVKKLAAESDIIYANEDDYDFDWATADSLFTIALNNNSKLIVYFTDTQKKIADIEFYSYLVEDTYWNYSEIGMRMVFADGSPSDFESYFGDGFSDYYDLIDEIIELMEIEDDYNY